MENNERQKQSLVLALPLLLAASLSEASAHDAELRREFADPPLRHQSRPLWFWNGKLDAEKTKGMVTACKAAGYYGMGILPCNGMGLDFMSPEFLKQYQVAVDEAGKLGMKMCLYDEFWLPRPKVQAVAYYRDSAQDRLENSIPIQQDQVGQWVDKAGVTRLGHIHLSTFHLEKPTSRDVVLTTTR